MKDECCANCRFLRVSKGNAPWITRYSCTADVRIEPLGVFDDYTGRGYNAAWTDLENRVCSRYRSEKETTRKLSELCGTLDDGPVKGVCGRMEWKKSGCLYDVYEFTCCGYEYSESRTCDFQTELDPNFCPNCGARIEECE